ncbi:hypothetical protein GQQ22_13415 [Pantoea agglomerans]|uniref:hypothetical protein n=1 Tax=Enterobacter agglomerans TaxID=549 RepID=UPI0013BD4FAB|nr:hypothetical protein [Pantoea agglomerans]NEG85064.1 hypothetical protein [Pantoea agglomerans]NEG99719.1 hypothetical protein [Pantoea agglomerans]NEH07011.1 hypothetical protein [Pantoea agglomerans]
MSKFKLGEEVSWSSSANGSTKKKIGNVVDVIPAGKPISSSKFKTLSGGGLPRKEESYVVCVDVKPGSRGKPKYYWPRVSALSLHKDS